MAIQKITRPSLFGAILNAVRAQSKPLIFVATFCVSMVVLFFAYKLWMTKRERAVQYDFSSLMTEYETVSHDKNPEWDALLAKFEKSYEKHAHSSLMPYYLGYKVRILLHQGKKDEALATLQTMIADMPGSPLLAVYEMEQGLIQLDSADADAQAAGLKTLEKLAYDTQNQFRDSAQYYLGRYYWANNDMVAARNIWQKLVDEQHDEKMAPSPWISYVQDKLSLTIV